MKRFAIALAPMAIMASAQSPYEVAPQAYHLDFENEYLRIERVTLAPHEKVPMHVHPIGPTVYIYTQDDGPVQFAHYGLGTINRRAVEKGQIRMSSGSVEMHTVENLSDQPNLYLRVELKMDTMNLHTRSIRLRPDEAFENDKLRITRMPAGAPEFPAVDVEYESGRGVFRKPGEAAGVPDVRIEMKGFPTP